MNIPLQCKEGSQSRNKTGKKALRLYTRRVLNEICNILLVKNLELQYHVPQNGNDVGTGSPCLTVSHWWMNEWMNRITLTITIFTSINAQTATNAAFAITLLGISIQAYGKRQPILLQFALFFCFQVHNPNIKRLSVSTPKEFHPYTYTWYNLFTLFHYFTAQKYCFVI